MDVTNLVQIVDGITRDGVSGGRNVWEALRLRGRLLPASVLTAAAGEGLHRVVMRVAGVKWRQIVSVNLFSVMMIAVN